MLFAVCERPPAQRGLPASRPANAGSINSKAKSIIFPSVDAASAPANLQFLDSEAALLRQIIETSMLGETHTRTRAIQFFAKRLIDESRQFLEKISKLRIEEFPARSPAINGSLPAVRALIQMLESGDIERLKAGDFDGTFIGFARLALDAIKSVSSVVGPSDSPVGTLAGEMRDWAESSLREAEKLSSHIPNIESDH